MDAPRLTRQDIVSVFILGEIVGASFFAISRVQSETLGAFVETIPVPGAILFLLGVPLAAFVAIWTAFQLGRKLAFLPQVAKFIAVGVSNTAIDWGVLNLLLVPIGFGTASYAGGKGLSFAVATLNSYFWNKTWTFQKKEFRGVRKEAVTFYLFTAVGLSINVVAATVFKELGPDTKFWAGLLAPGFATLISAVWDFFAYKLVVFRKR